MCLICFKYTTMSSFVPHPPPQPPSPLSAHVNHSDPIIKVYMNHAFKHASLHKSVICQNGALKYVCVCVCVLLCPHLLFVTSASKLLTAQWSILRLHTNSRQHPSSILPHGLVTIEENTKKLMELLTWRMYTHLCRTSCNAVTQAQVHTELLQFLINNNNNYYYYYY